MADILVVDDEIGIRELLSEILGDEGHTVLLADSARQAREVRAAQPVDLVLLDIWMPDTDGVTLLREWAGNGQLSMPVIMMSGHATIDTAVEATRIGAIDFLEKPITLQKLLRSVSAGLAHPRPAQVSLNRADPGRGPATRPLFSETPAAAPRTGMTDRIAFAQDGSGIAGAALNPARPGGEPTEIDSAPSHRPGAGLGMPESPERADGAYLSEKIRSPAISIQSLPLDAPLRDARDAFERAYFEYHLQREQGSMTRVAERTGLERTHLYRKLKQLGVDLSRGAWRKREP